MSALTKSAMAIVQSSKNGTDNFEHEHDPHAASFVYTIVKHLGLCVRMTSYLSWVLDVTCIVQTVISVLGIVGAALSLRVTCLKKNRSSLSVQVAVLSLYDLLFLSAVLVTAILNLTNVTDDVIIGLIYGVRQLGLWGVTYTMVDISIERYVSIDRPFLARKMCGVSFTLKRSAVILVAGLILSVFFVLDLVLGLSSKPECESRRALTMYGVVFTLYIAILLFYLIPFACIFLANVKLILALYRVGSKHNQIVSASSSSQVAASAKQLSLFVVGMCVWYSICMLAPSILFLVRLTRVELLKPERDMAAAAAADTLVVLSTAANFLFYFLMWRHFRHTFMALFCGSCHSADLNSSSSLEGKAGQFCHINSKSEQLALKGHTTGSSDLVPDPPRNSS